MKLQIQKENQYLCGFSSQNMKKLEFKEERN